MSRQDPSQEVSNAELRVQNVHERKNESQSLQSLVETIVKALSTRAREGSVKMGQEIRERQQRIHWIHTLLKRINARISRETGELDLKLTTSMSDEERDLVLKIREQLAEASLDEGFGVYFREHYSKEEQEKLIYNFRTTVADLETQNQMQSEDLGQLMKEFYEAVPWAKQIYQTLHHTIERMINAISR